MNRRMLYAGIRDPLFRGRLSQGQVDGIECLLDTWATLIEQDLWPEIDWRWLAYVLATAYHETGGAMRPVREVGRGRGRPYGEPDPETGQVYYGRGHVQLTWRQNYERQGKKLGLPLLTDPDLALDPPVSAMILLRGMSDGDFTGRGLRHYFRADGTQNPVEARHIVNGTDCAQAIAGYYETVHAAILRAATVAAA